MSKYEPLTDFLAAGKRDALRMSFEEIEKILGFPLPPSKAYRAWWSNNPSNSVMTKAWLAAGYKTERVDVENGQVTFVRSADTARPAGVDMAKPPRSPVFGCMKGTTFVADGVDLVVPVDPHWGDVYNDQTLPVSADAEAIRADPSLNISQKIRALAELGIGRADIARMLGKRYQHVRNVLVDAEQRTGR